VGNLHCPADQFRLRGFSRHCVHVLFKADGEIDLRLTEDPSKTGREQPGEDTCQHAPYQKRPDHQDRFSVTGKAEQVAAVVHEFMDIHTRKK
jgi:hypothetical protein